MEIFEKYKPKSYDEMLQSDGEIKEQWKILAQNIQNIGLAGLEQKQYEIDWQLEENGVTYNIYNSESAKNKRWNLDPIPFIIDEKEWNELKKGLNQRAKLLDFIFKDIYGEQKLLKDEIVPPEIFYLDPHFIREVYGFNKEYYSLNFYAVDISRGPDGKFWIVTDRTDSPSGLGYAIENRLTINTINHDLVQNINIEKIKCFIDGFKENLQKKSNLEQPFIVMLSPGPYNETYFEHSYLSSFLDCELVQGHDLFVKDSCLYLKNISGLKKVDILLRRVDDRYCDPLELKNDSQLGVPGLIDVLRKNNVLMINPIGIGILENFALNPFMKNICKYFLNEPLLIPQIATWWCGQEKEKEYVLENLDKMIIKTIDKKNPDNSTICKKLAPERLQALKEKIEKTPYMYIAQEHIDFSTTPSFRNGKIESQKNSIRTFCYKDEEDYTILNGGLVRVASSKDNFFVSSQRGGGNKDLWIVTKEKSLEEPSYILPLYDKKNELSISSLTTKRAENLFWLGRYLERTMVGARMMRLNIKNLKNLNRFEDKEMAKKLQSIFNTSLTHLTMTYPGFLDDKVTNPFKEIESVIKDGNRTGSLTFSFSMLSNVNLNIKNQLTHESWKIFDKLEKEWYEYINQKTLRYTEHLDALDNFLIHIMAYKELLYESIFTEQGLAFYQIGSLLETAILLISKIRSMLSLKHTKVVENEVLQFLLYSYEGYNSFKAFYKAPLQNELVLDFLIFQKNYPKSLLCIIQTLLSLIDSINLDTKAQNDFKSSGKYIYKVLAKLKFSLTSELLETDDESVIFSKLDQFLSEVSTLLIDFSNEFTKEYFSHYYE